MAASYVHRINRRALFYAAIPLLAGISDASAAWAHHANRSALDWLAIFAPRLGFALVLALVVYGLFLMARAGLARLNGVALAAQPTWHFLGASAAPIRP